MADRLTRQHRTAQLALRAATLRDLLRLWPAFDVERIPQTWPAFERATLLLIQQRGRLSAALAYRYYLAHRRAAGVVGSPARMEATPTDEEILAGLRVVGPIEAARALALRRTAEDVAQATLTKLAGTVGMYVLDHGRDVLMNAIDTDRQALGWARQVSAAPCAFCAMLASRGPVYRSEESASFESHRHCACTPVPQWTTDQEWPEGSRDLQVRWNDATTGVTGAGEKFRAFRRALEASGP